MKKLISIIIFLLMFFNFALFSSAEKVNIVISEIKEDGAVFNAWKMADLVKEDGIYSFVVVPEWITFFKDEASARVAFDFSNDGSNIIHSRSNVTNEQLEEVVKAAANYAVTKNINPSGTAVSKDVGNNASVTIALSDIGYYCIDSTPVAFCVVDEFDVQIVQKSDKTEEDVPSIEVSDKTEEDVPSIEESGKTEEDVPVELPSATSTPEQKEKDHVFQDNIKVKNKDSGGIEQYLFAFICGGIIVFSIAIIVIVFVIKKKKNAK